MYRCILNRKRIYRKVNDQIRNVAFNHFQNAYQLLGFVIKNENK